MSLLHVTAVVVALVSGCRPAAPATEAAAQSRPPGNSVSDPNDFYFYDGKPVRLDRATSEFVVGLANEADATTLLQGASVPARAGDPISVRGRRFILVTIDASPRPADGMNQLIDAMRARPDVWFAAPIYYRPATRVRVVPTDDLVVRTKPSTTPDRLSGILKDKGLRQVSLMEGTTDQYVLRIVSAKNADVLRMARDLYESGLFLWAEPDFIQELRREG